MQKHQGLHNKQMSILTSEETAYIAGLFDGEGTVDIHLDKRRNSFYPRASIEMTHFESVIWLQDKFPGQKLLIVNRPNHPKHSSTIRWCIQGKPAIRIIELLLPFLKAKRAEAILFITFPYPDFETRGTGRSVPPDIVKRRSELKSLLHESKTKGKGLLKWQTST